MNKKIAIIAGIIAGVIVILLLVLAYFGLFASVNIVEKKIGPFQLVYEKHTGDYSKVGDVMDKLDEKLKKDGIECSKAFGLYYDNPEMVEKDKLRSIAGYILEIKNKAKIRALSKRYNIRKYPASKSVVAEFPFRGMPSIIIGKMRVYPKLGKYLKDKKYPDVPIMEIYDGPGKTLQYIASVRTGKAVFNSFLKKTRK